MEPKVRSGARVPLFDRLVDTEPESTREIRPLRILDTQGLRESVCRELGRLLNTRRPIPLSSVSDERTVITYGIPDFSALSPQNSENRDRLENDIRQAIVSYEPRLSDVKVTIEPPQQEDRTLTARVEGRLELESIRDPVAFLVVIRRNAGPE